MTDEMKIRQAWRKAPSWNFAERPVLKMPEPLDFSELPIGPEGVPTSATINVVEFRSERKAYNGRPAYRVVGKLRETEVTVAQYTGGVLR